VVDEYDLGFDGFAMCNKKLGHQVMFPPSNGMGLLRRGKVAGMLVVTRET
jgi:hypothetical protein